MVLFLLNTAHMHVNAKSKDLWSPFHYAAFNGHARILTILESHGADVNARDKRLRTALHWAVLFSTAKVVEHLLKLGIVYELQDYDGKDALTLAR